MFDKEYWEPDKGRVNCMACGDVIMAFHPKSNKWMRLSNYKDVVQKRVVLEDGSTSALFLCRICQSVNVDIESDSVNADKVRKQYEKAFRKNIKIRGENKRDRDHVNIFKDIKVLKKIDNLPPSNLKQEAIKVLNAIKAKGNIEIRRTNHWLEHTRK